MRSALLVADHKKVQKAFKDFEKLKDGNNKRAKSEIVRQTCADLTVHAARKNMRRAGGWGGLNVLASWFELAGATWK